MKTEPYLSMIDLYAARAARNRVVPLERPETPPVIAIGRRPRPSLSWSPFRGRSEALPTGRRRVATIQPG